MNAPFYKFNMFGFDVSLIIAFAIGIGFGFMLERGGFGSARILAAQFYLGNMRVLKVMFTAIVTAMLGVYYLSVFGFRFIIDLHKQHLYNSTGFRRIDSWYWFCYWWILSGYIIGRFFYRKDG